MILEEQKTIVIKPNVERKVKKNVENQKNLKKIALEDSKNKKKKNKRRYNEKKEQKRF